MESEKGDLVSRALALIRPSDLAPYPDKYGCSIEEADYNEWLSGAKSVAELKLEGASWQAQEWACHSSEKARVAVLALLIHAIQAPDHDPTPLCESSGFFTDAQAREKIFEQEDYPVILELLKSIHGQQQECDYRDVYLARHIGLFEECLRDSPKK